MVVLALRSVVTLLVSAVLITTGVFVKGSTSILEGPLKHLAGWLLILLAGALLVILVVDTRWSNPGPGSAQQAAPLPIARARVRAASNQATTAERRP